MKQIKQIWPAEAFTGILLGDHLSCNLIKFLITGGRGLRGLRHRTVLLQTSLLLLLLHFTQVDRQTTRPDQITFHSSQISHGQVQSLRQKRQQPSNMPQITGLDVTCEKTGMIVSLQFSAPFNGVVFSKGHFSNPACR